MICEECHGNLIREDHAKCYRKAFEQAIARYLLSLSDKRLKQFMEILKR